MKKFFKGLFATALAVTFLASCGGVEHTVSFYEDNLGTFYKEVKVKDGKKIEMPADPVKTGYEFQGWYNESTYATAFDKELPIVKDMDVFGKWQKEFEVDTRTYHLVGSLKNTELDYISYSVDPEEIDERSYLVKEDLPNRNLYSITVEIGYLGDFKVKVPEIAWDTPGYLQFEYQHLREESYEFLKESGIRNIQVKTAGEYKISVDTTAEWIHVERLGDAKGEGVTPDSDVAPDYGIVGTMNEWGATDDIPLNYDLEGEFYYRNAMYLAEGDAFKLRYLDDTTWAGAWGYKVDNKLDEELFEESENDSNIVALVAGYYTFFFIDGDYLQIEPLTFVLRGSAFGEGGWDVDSEPLVLQTEEVTAETLELTYEGTYTLAAGEFKAKLGAYGPEEGGVSGWDIAFGGGAEGGDNITVTAGDYKVTLVVTYDPAEDTFSGVLTHVPA